MSVEKDLFCYEMVSLYFNAKNLTKMDYLSNTDAFIVVFEVDSKTNQVTRLGNIFDLRNWFYYYYYYYYYHHHIIIIIIR